jgi:hypothetical protein
MFNKALCFALVIITLSSCMDGAQGEKTVGQKTHYADITDNEDRGISEVLDLYGGKCKYSSGIAASGSFGSTKYFELVLTNCTSLEERKNLSELSAANVAYLFYINLKDEKKKYAEIRTEIIFDEDDYKGTYRDSVLDLVVTKMKIVRGIIDLLKGKNYTALADTLNDHNFFENFNKKEFVDHIKEIDQTLGNIKEFVPYGFSFFDTVDGKTLLHISGLIRRDKKSNEFSVNIDPLSNDNKAIMIKYEL